MIFLIFCRHEIYDGHRIHQPPDTRVVVAVVVLISNLYFFIILFDYYYYYYYYFIIYIFINVGSGAPLDLLFRGFTFL